ncbi:hypothetical protein V5T82_04115 [Magnetovibrio sp. PR-2]|uniref:hypothetical protein n=1 Tax=Magnetovibrio sp. PR-2 TaxID=3120356 RepID=UPI002FCE55EC
MTDSTYKITNGCSVTQRSGSSLWMSYINVDGKPLRKSTGTANLAEAIKIAEERYKDAKDRVRRGQSVSVPTFAAAAAERRDIRIAEIDKNKRRGKLTKNRATNKRGELNRSITYLTNFVEDQIGAHTTIDHIGRVDWDAYPEWRQDLRDQEIEFREAAFAKRRDDLTYKWETSSKIRKWYKNLEAYLDKKLESTTGGLGPLKLEVRPTTFRVEYAILRDLMKWCRKKKWLTKADEPELPEITNIIKPRYSFTPDEMSKLWAVAQERYCATRRQIKQRFGKDAYQEILSKDKEAVSRKRILWATILLSATGMRPKSLCEIRRHDVIENPSGSGARKPLRPDGGEGKRSDGSTYPFYALQVTTYKGGQVLTRPVVPESWALEAIDTMISDLKPDDFIIGGTSASLGKGIKKVIRETGLEHGISGEIRTMYSLRHGYINKQLRAGVAPVVVAKNVLSSLEMIEKYYSEIGALNFFDQLSGH